MKIELKFSTQNYSKFYHINDVIYLKNCIDKTLEYLDDRYLSCFRIANSKMSEEVVQYKKIKGKEIFNHKSFDFKFKDSPSGDHYLFGFHNHGDLFKLDDHTNIFYKDLFSPKEYIFLEQEAYKIVKSSIREEDLFQYSIPYFVISKLLQQIYVSILFQ